MTTEDREKLKVQLMRHEGIVLKHGRAVPYTDTVGKITIGYGRNLSDRGVSLDEAAFLLENDLADTLTDCDRFPWFANLDGVRQRVVADLCFNLGLARLRTFTATLGAIERGEFAFAAAALLKSKYASQVGQRAVRLARMLETGREPLA